MSNDFLFLVMDLEMPIWEQDKFMIPVISDDPLLMYDFDGDADTKKANSQTSSERVGERGVTVKPSESQKYSNFRVANAEEGHVTLSQAHFDDLHAALQRMQLVVDESNATMKQYQKDMESMRKVCKLATIKC